jgi:hypothetical protein
MRSQAAKATGADISGNTAFSIAMAASNMYQRHPRSRLAQPLRAMRA